MYTVLFLVQKTDTSDPVMTTVNFTSVTDATNAVNTWKASNLSRYAQLLKTS
jgi:hypothetical protein